MSQDRAVTALWRTSTFGSELNDAVGIITASQPARFSSVAMKLEEIASPMHPVSGDLVSTANLLDVVRRLPTKGLVTKMRGLAGSKGSTPAGQKV